MKEKSKILVTDDVHPNLLEGLAKLGEVDYQPTISYQAVQDIISSYHGLIINSKIQEVEISNDYYPSFSKFKNE